MSKSASNRKTSRAALVVINLAVFIGLLVLLEVFVRMLVPAVQSQGMDAALVYPDRFGTTPGLLPESQGVAFGKSVKVDSRGFRKSTVPFSRNKKTWLYLGDSVTMGVGVDDDSVYVARMDEALIDYNLANPSVIGWGVENYLEAARYFLEIENNQHQISYITVAWCLNDIYRGMPPAEYEGMQFKKRIHRYTTWLRENSHAYIFLKGIFFDRPRAYFDFDRQFYHNEDENTERALQLMEELAFLCAQHDVSFNVLLLPYEVQLREPNSRDSNAPFDFMQEKLSAEGISVLDTRGAFSSVRPSSEYYLFADGIHFSNIGHRVLADFLLKELKE